MKKITLFLFLNAFFIINAQTTYTVTTQAEFDSADSSAVAGDIIEWPNGTYSDIYMDIDTNDITVRAETPGGVVFSGASRANIDASNITFTGFQYIDVNILIEGSTSTVDQTIVNIDGSNNNISHINFSQNTCWKYLRIRDSSQYTNVSNCNFESRINYANQNILQIDASATQPGFHNISYCSFKNFTGDPVNDTNGDDGVEPIRTGSSSQSEYSSKTVIEYCYFTGCNGDDEVISGKASDCIYRYNTLEANEGEIVLRHGNRGIVYGNFFINNEAGVRVREGKDHIIYNNYFNGLTAESIKLQSQQYDPTEDVLEDLLLTRVENVIVAHNTFVGTDNIDLGDVEEFTDPFNTIFINNLFQATTSSNYFRDETGDETFAGNIIDTFDDLGLSATTGFTETDPMLSLNTEGFYQLEATSPAIDTAVDNAVFPFPIVTDLAYDNEILLDIISEARPPVVTSKDVGAQEYSATATVGPYVTAENTGPVYPDIPTLSINSFENQLGTSVTFFPNPIIGSNLYIQLDNQLNENLEVSIYDITGKKVLSTLIGDTPKTNSIYEIDLPSNLKRGIYLIQLNVLDNNGKIVASKSQKLIKWVSK